MIQIYRTTSNFLDKSQSLQQVDRRICLTLNQLERDLSSAFIPFLHEKEKKDEKEKPEEFKKRKKEEEKKYFVAQYDADQFFKIEDKRKYLFKSLNFVTTNPLQVYGQKRTRLVRVKYELIQDKVKLRQGKECYHLFRSETDDLSNFEFKNVQDVFDRKKMVSVRRHLLLSNIKSMVFEYVTLKTKKDEEKDIFKKEEEDISRKFSWQDEAGEDKDEETKEVVPRQVELWFTFWDEKFVKEYNFKAMIPIFSYPTVKLDLKVTTTPQQSRNQKTTRIGQPRPNHSPGDM